MTTTLDPALLPAVADFVGTDRKMLIGGHWVDSVSGRTFATHDPATGQVITTVAHGEAADIDRAVAAARAAYEGPWSRMRPNERERLIWRIGDLLSERADVFGQLEALDNGKSVSIASAVDVPWSADVWRYNAGLVTKISGSSITPSMPFAPPEQQFHAYTRRESLGVCGQIVPWNFPILMTTWKLAPALAAGNTVVLKPAEQTPLSALMLGELFEEAGFPPGVVNIVPGYGDAGAALSAHMDVDKVAFTGSTEVGKKIVQASTGNLKKVSLELGGKSPNIVYADADFDAAVAGSVAAWMFNHGQCCVAGTRMFVQREIFDDFTQAVADAASQAKIGPGLDPTTELGPLVSQEQFDRVSSYIQQGLADGARALTGGKRWGTEGYFVEPTVFVDAKPEFSIVEEEIFGPVVVALPFDGEQDVAQAANNSIYGLAAGIWTKDLSKAHRTAAAVQAGSVWVNQYNGFDTALPFGGFKQSGWGRELGDSAIDLYTQTKSVNVAL